MNTVYTVHLVNGRYICKEHILKYFPDRSKCYCQHTYKEDEIFPLHQLKILCSLFGSIVDNIQAAILVAVERTTAVIRWGQAVQVTIDSDSGGEEGDVSIFEDALNYIKALGLGIKENLANLPSILVDLGLDMASWFMLILGAFIFLMWIYSTFKHCIILALPLAFIEHIKGYCK